MTLEAEALADRRRLRRKVSFWRVAAFLIAIVAILVGFGLVSDDTGLIPSDHVARIEISGMITDDRDTQQVLKRIAENTRAKALIVAIDSPGGTSAGAEALFAAIRGVADEKPVVATLGTLAASGGYAAAVAADHIVTRGNTLAGSVGVIIQWPNAEQLLDNIGVRVEEVKSSPIKAEPDAFSETPPEAIAILEETVADSRQWFVDLVAERRGLSRQQAAVVGTARIYTGRQAVTAKLADQIGGEEEARAWLQSEHDVDRDLKVRTYRPSNPFDPRSPAESMIGAAARALGLARLAANLAPDSLRLDGLVSVWHPHADSE